MKGEVTNGCYQIMAVRWEMRLLLLIFVAHDSTPLRDSTDARTDARLALAMHAMAMACLPTVGQPCTSFSSCKEQANDRRPSFAWHGQGCGVPPRAAKGQPGPHGAAKAAPWPASSTPSAKQPAQREHAQSCVLARAEEARLSAHHFWREIRFKDSIVPTVPRAQ